MSNLYRKKNSESTKDLFDKKLIYNLKSKVLVNHTGLVDFSFAEKALYGRVDRLYVPMIVAESPAMPTKNIKSKEGQNNVRALSFVTDAYEALARQFLKKYSSNEISLGEQYLSQIIAHNGYVSPIQKYDEYTQIFIESIGDIIREKKLYFRDFEDFMNKIMSNIESAIKKFPLTMSAFVKSRECPMAASGLTINISDLDFVNDAEKIRTFYESPNWQFYVNAANSYGFMVDRNNPSVLVADIASGDMLKFAEPYGLLDTDTILNTAYKPAHFDCLNQIREIFYNIYNRYKVKRYTMSTHVYPNRRKTVTVTPRTYSYNDFLKEYDDNYFLNLYCKLRFLEEESVFTKGEMFRLTDDTLELAKTDMSKALMSFEIIINKTFDYRGSLSYYKMRLDKKRK